MQEVDRLSNLSCLVPRFKTAGFAPMREGRPVAQRRSVTRTDWPAWLTVDDWFVTGRQTVRSPATNPRRGAVVGVVKYRRGVTDIHAAATDRYRRRRRRSPGLLSGPARACPGELVGTPADCCGSDADDAFASDADEQ